MVRMVGRIPLYLGSLYPLVAPDEGVADGCVEGDDDEGDREGAAVVVAAADDGNPGGRPFGG